jgi:hypothetical protein
VSSIGKALRSLLGELAIPKEVLKLAGGEDVMSTGEASVDPPKKTDSGVTTQAVGGSR